MSDTLRIRYASLTSVSAILAFAAVQGAIVNYDPAHPEKFALANGQRGYRLERDVVAALDLKDLIFKDQLFRPDLVNSAVSARKTIEEEVEGAALLHLTALTPAGWVTATAKALGAAVTPTVANGRVYVCTTAGTTGATEPVWPVVAGGTVTDGTAVFTEAGGAISNATPAETPLTTYGGKLRVAAPGDEIYGILRAQLTPVVTGNTVRVLVEVMQ